MTRGVNLPPGHPEPEVWARAASPDEMPANARKLAQLAEDCHWRVRATYARGTSLPTRTKPDGELVESIAVRMRRDDRALVGVWLRPAGSDRALRFIWGGAPFETMTLAELRKALDS